MADSTSGAGMLDIGCGRIIDILDGQVTANRLERKR